MCIKQAVLSHGDRNGAGPCVGDSGGGLYLLEGGKWRLRGVVSVSLRAENGDNTCNLNEYIIFTDTAKYLGWIRRILSEKYYD
uniref:SFRICE_029542 n=1 Tax=Spodoptera frugiperda TaxID=7108 RepID=A0A2H1WH83_SPOFR